jgi:hypothetical protein
MLQLGGDHLAGTVLGLVAVALGAPASPAPAVDPAVRAGLEALSRRSVVFGHQSVGMNLLDGLQQLAAREGVPLRIVDVSAAPAAPPRTLAHLFVPENGKPATKLERFAQALEAIRAGGPDIALLKLCYVDFDPPIDVAALFARYQETFARLQAAHPGTRFVHVTAPLTTVQGGPRAWAKRLLGRTPYGLAENARRDEFNTLLRTAYEGRAPIFDLARTESTRPDGSRATATWNGRTFPVLVEAYTDDEGHLNQDGRLRAARELLAVLAATSDGPAPRAR